MRFFCEHTNLKLFLKARFEEGKKSFFWRRNSLPSSRVNNDFKRENVPVRVANVCVYF